MSKVKPFTKEMIKLSDKIMEDEAFIEFLEEQLEKHLSTEARDRYRGQLKTAKNRLSKSEKKFKELLEEI